jgi:hypothetical protein
MRILLSYKKNRKDIIEDFIPIFLILDKEIL